MTNDEQEADNKICPFRRKYLPLQAFVVNKSGLKEDYNDRDWDNWDVQENCFNRTRHSVIVINEYGTLEYIETGLLDDNGKVIIPAQHGLYAAVDVYGPLRDQRFVAGYISQTHRPISE